MKEKSSKPPLRLATALLETAAGIDGNFGSSCPRTLAAQSTRREKAESFFIAEILPHNPRFRFAARNWSQNLALNLASEPASEPRLAAVLAVGITECRFEDLCFTAGAKRLHDDDGQKDQPEDGPVDQQHKSRSHYSSEYIDRIANFRINSVRHQLVSLGPEGEGLAQLVASGRNPAHTRHYQA